LWLLRSWWPRRPQHLWVLTAVAVGLRLACKSGGAVVPCFGLWQLSNQFGKWVTPIFALIVSLSILEILTEGHQ
jgi:hypothetical protein